MVLVQARHYTPTNGRQIDLIVIHDMETPEDARRAETVSAWFAGSSAPRASAHWCFDPDSAVRCVLDKDVAWHAPGANNNGLGYEHAGYARQTRAEWMDKPSLATLRVSSRQAAIDCKKYNIPVRYVDAAGLLRGERGITTHLQVSKAFKRSTHWDPGYEFPMDIYLAYVKEALGGAVVSSPQKAPVASGSSVLREGSRGGEVVQWQNILIGAGTLPKGSADGVFGAKTKAATIAFQKMLKVTPDGIVGKATHEATARLLAWLAAQAKPKPVSPTVPPFPGTVKRGSTGSAVRQVQQRFAARGWKISVDGNFGPGTEAVVKSFQKEKGLHVDGIVGPATWRAMWTLPR